MDLAAESGVIHETLAVVRFCTGGWRVGVEARQVRGSRPATEESPGGEFATVLGLPAVAASLLGRQYLTLKRSIRDEAEGLVEILVDAPVELLSLPVATIHPLPPLLAARIRLHGLRALAMQAEAGEKALTLLFDADTF